MVWGDGLRAYVGISLFGRNGVDCSRKEIPFEERGRFFHQAQSFNPQNQAAVEKRRTFQGAVSATEDAVFETHVERTSDHRAARERSCNGKIHLYPVGKASVSERAVFIAGTVFRCAAIPIERVDGVQIGRGCFYASATQARFGASVVRLRRAVENQFGGIYEQKL